MKVLIVDDSPIVTKMISQYLGAKGCDVEVMNSPFGVSNRIREFSPDVLLMDLGLPGLSGSQLLSMCSKSAEKPPVIIIISAEEEKMKELVKQGLANDYFVKGTSMNELVQKISAYTPR